MPRRLVFTGASEGSALASGSTKREERRGGGMLVLLVGMVDDSNLPGREKVKESEDGKRAIPKWIR